MRLQYSVVNSSSMLYISNKRDVQRIQRLWNVSSALL